MLVTEKFIRSLVEKYGKHTVYILIEVHGLHEASSVIGLKHYLHSPFEKSLVESVNQQYFKDRMESFDDYYPCIQKEENECNLFHVHNWIQFFVLYV